MASRTSQAQRASVQSAALDPSLVAGGRYRTQTRLGRGGAASVFLAVEVGTDRRVALKRLEPQASPRVASLFELEYHTLSSLKHPNIVQVYDYGTDENGPYYVMELLEGCDLGTRKVRDYREAAQIAMDVASALSLLHSRQLVHRDVSARNVWCLDSGGVKLIDFGALTTFGPCAELVGTPPHIAPEALQSRSVDQRTDLYALGALLYWLVTGVHAYPARTLRDLPRFWAEPALSLFEQLQNQGKSADDIPKELDVLVMSLLAHNPLARPGTTGEVIDRLSAVLGLPPSRRNQVVDISLSQPALTGRERELREFRRQLEQLRKGQGEVTVFGARPGCGRTRLLSELAVDARISGAHVLHIQSGDCSGEHGVAEAIVQRLLETLPDTAQRAVQEHAPVLGHLSKAMEQRLAVPLLAMPQVAGEARANIHEALTGFVTRIAIGTPLVILVDDLESADESSVGWLAALASATSAHPLLLGISLVEGANEERSFITRALRQHARRITLKPLSAPETKAILASLFGEVPYLPRLAERIYRVTQGVPARVIDLARQLAREGVVANLDGTWVLPQEVPEELLQLDRGERIKLSIARLSEDARSLGALLSVRHGPMPIELCKALSELPAKQLFPALEELSREELLQKNALGYYFADELAQAALRQLLDEKAAAGAHLRLGAFLIGEAQEASLERLTALVHRMEGGDLGEAPDQIARLAIDLTRENPDRAAQAAPSMERALKLFRAAGRAENQFVALLASLALAGYFSDRRLVARYGDRALSAISDLLRVPLMHRLRPWLGRRLSLIVGLVVAGIGLRRRPLPGKPKLKEVLQLYFHCLGAISGVSTICVDPAGVRRCSYLTEPFTALGKDHVAAFLHEFTKSLAMTVQDRCGSARARWQEQIAALEDPNRLRDFPEALRQRYLAGALYAYGVLECWRDSPTALSIADRLESFGVKLYQMSADQLRSVYYANQGNRALYEQYRARAELHAIQRGSAWQIETWAPGAAITVHLRTHDAMGLKECQEQLARLEKLIPSLALISRRCKGAFLYLRKRFEEALPLLEECLSEEPLGVIGWARAHGVLAGCLNAMGQHARAKQVCEAVLQKLSPEDLDFPAMNLNLVIELAHAEAGLGNLALAASQLDALLQKHAAGNGPLTLGALHEARARLALRAGDKRACEHHAREMMTRYMATGLASLVACCEAFTREQRRQFSPLVRREGEHTGLISSGFSIGPTTLERALTETEGAFESRVQKALDMVSMQLGSPPAALYVSWDGHVQLKAFQGGRQPHRDVQAWVEEYIRSSDHDDVTQTDFSGGAPEDPDVFTLGGTRHRLFLLVADVDERQMAVGAITFEEPVHLRHFLPPAVLTSIATWLYRTLTNPSVMTSLHTRSVLPS